MLLKTTLTPGLALPKCFRVLQPEDVATLQKEASAKGRSEASIILLEYEAARLLDALASSKSLEARSKHRKPSRQPSRLP